MAFFDMPLDQLRAYQPVRGEPSDFDSFWQSTLAEARQHPTLLELTPLDLGFRQLDFFDVTFHGYAGQPIKAWLIMPANRAQGEKLPAIVQYHGYSCGRDEAFIYTKWASAGYAHFVMDNRGQGGTALRGNTPDESDDMLGMGNSGFMTRGILNAETYYYRRLFTDAVRLVDAVVTCDWVDSQRVVIQGISQGGGIALAVAGLSEWVKAAMINVPFLCHFERATEITDAYPYAEISEYCKAYRTRMENIFCTLEYFDGVNMAARAKAKALFSAGLMDDVCPPSTVFAAYNHYAGEKEIRIWKYNRHEGGGTEQEHEELKFMRQLGWVESK